MTPVEIHLALNHVPVLALPVALVFLAWGWRRRSTELMRAALVLLVAAALVSIPVYLTGEGAEEVVEHVDGVSHRAIHTHEDAALWSFIGLLASGAAALLALFLSTGPRMRAWPVILVLALGLVTLGITWRVAKLGGAIRHPEIATTASGAERPE